MLTSRGSYERLESLSDIRTTSDLTEDNVRDILRAYTRDHGLTIVKMGPLEDLSGENDAFNSTICSLSCQVRFSPKNAKHDGSSGSGGAASEEEFHFVVKCPPRSSFVRLVHKFTKPFCNEVSFYKDLVGQLELVFGKGCMSDRLPLCYYATSSYHSLEQRIDAGEVPSSGSNCFAASRLGAFCWPCSVPCKKPEEGVLVLENINKRSRKSYRMFPKLTPMPLDHVKMALGALAQFHGMWLRYRLRNQSGQLQSEAGSRVVIPWSRFLDRFTTQKKVPKVLYLNMKNVAKKAYVTVLDQADGEASVAAELGEDLRTCRRRLKRFFDVTASVALSDYFSDPPSPACHTLCHGDFWSSNVLFNYDQEAPGEAAAANKPPAASPLDLLIIDYQLVSFGNPCYDLVYFLYLNTDAEFRDAHLAEVLRLYYDRFSQYFDGSSELKEYTFERFVQDFNWHKVVGVVSSGAVMPNVFADVPVNMEGNIFTAFRHLAANQRKVLVNKTSSHSIEIRRRLMGIIKEMLRDGVM